MYNNYGFPYSMPTATQPYGVPMFPQSAPTAPQPTAPQAPQGNAITNKIYVTGIEGARQYQLPNGSDYILLDNDKAMIYRKTVDATGKMDVQAFDIVPHKEPVEHYSSEYALKSDLDALRKELETLKGNTTE